MWGMWGMLRFLSPATLTLAAALLSSGCLSTSYTVEREELARLARTAPAERGREVRVTQDLSFSSDPPPASASAPVQTHAGVDVGVALAVSATHHHPHPDHGPARAGVVRTGRAAGTDGPRRAGTVTTGGGAVGGTGSSGGGSGGTGAGGSGGSSGDGGSGGSGGSSGDGGSGGSSGDGSVALAVLMVAASAGVGVALAVTEGARYDGWVSISPDHPVHLEGPDGEQVWVPLAGLDPGLADWAEEGRISGEEGAVFRTGRAPLDRVGFVYSVTLGAAETGTFDRTGELGFAARTSFGYFPIQQLGLVAGLGVGVAGGDVEWRPHLELQSYPLAIGRAHAGIYLQGGHSFGTDGTQDVDGWYWGSGLLAQIDLTTRLALDLRGGFAVLTDPGDPQVAPEALVGLSIY